MENGHDTPPSEELEKVRPQAERPEGNGSMRAIVQDAYGSADVLRLARIPEPEPPTKSLSGSMPPESPRHLAPDHGEAVPAPSRVRPPQTQEPGSGPGRGRDRRGRGSAVTRFRPGDEVFGFGRGSFAQYTVAREDKLALKPGTLSFEQAAVVPVSASTALQGLRAGGGHAGRRC